jgi:hypothetical protein
MTAPLPFPVAAQCGYCDRHLVACERGYECPRCAPLLRSLPGAQQYASTLAAFGRFQRDARKDRVR